MCDFKILNGLVLKRSAKNPTITEKLRRDRHLNEMLKVDKAVNHLLVSETVENRKEERCNQSNSPGLWNPFPRPCRRNHDPFHDGKVANS